MADQKIDLMAHLMRRAGFGAAREELEARAEKGYEATVEELVNPQEDAVDKYEFYRYHPGYIRHITSPVQALGCLILWMGVPDLLLVWVVLDPTNTELLIPPGL